MGILEGTKGRAANAPDILHEGSTTERSWSLKARMTIGGLLRSGALSVVLTALCPDGGGVGAPCKKASHGVVAGPASGVSYDVGVSFSTGSKDLDLYGYLPYKF